MKKRFLALVALALVTTAISLTGCKKNDDQITLVLDWTPNTNHTGFFVAKELGYYEEEGLNIEIIQPPESSSTSLVAAQQAEFGIGFQEELASALTADQPLSVTAIGSILSHNTGGILSLKEKGITSFDQLEGKTFGSWGIPIYDMIVEDCVTKAGGDFSKVTLVPNNATDTLTAIQTDFDAVWAYEGWDGALAKAKGLDVNFVPFISENPVLDYYTPIIITNNDFMSKNPEVVKKFMAATAKGYQYAVEFPDEAAVILQKNAPELDLDLMSASQQFLSQYYLTESGAFGTIDEKRWTDFNNWLYEKGIIPEKIAEKGFTNAYLPN